MNEDFVSEETARLAKKANFNEPCLFFYYNGKLHFHKLKRRLKMMYLKYTEFETICNYKLILNRKKFAGVRLGQARIRRRGSKF